MAAACASVTGASTTAASLWSFNGPVDSLVVSGHTLYVGGKFSQISPRTGPLLAVSAASGTPISRFPRPSDGSISALLADGRGGWFVGGNFTRLGGVACRNLAHVKVSLAVDRHFCPRPNGGVDTLTLEGSTLYAGGDFTRMGSARRSYAAALNASTGAVSSWAPPAIDSVVSDIAVRSGVLYLLGGFSTVGGKKRFSLAAVDIRTRRVTGWDPKAPTFGGHGDTSTRAIAAGPHAIYVAGIFDHIGGKKLPGLAALDPVTGRATGFVPKGKPWSVDSLAVAGGRLYAGGFTHTGGYAAAYDAATGRSVWLGAADPGGVEALAVGGSRLFAGGEKLQAFATATGRRVPWAPPPPNQPVAALAVSGAKVLVGGTFTGAGGVARDGLAAVDLATGLPTSWHPRLTGSLGLHPEVTALALSGSTLYIGGDFSRVGGKPRVEIAAVNVAGGQSTGWAPQLTSDNQVLSIGVGESNVYFGGFGVASSYDSAGKLRWNSPPGGIASLVDVMLVSGGLIYVGGMFDVIGGANRHALVALDARNGSTTSWNPRISEGDGNEEVAALALSGSTLYVGGSFDSAGSAKRDQLASFDVRSQKLTTWAPKVGEILDVHAVAVTRSAVYAGGEGGAAAFDPRTGATLRWHPSLASGLNGPYAHAITVVGKTVYVGDDGGVETFPAAG